MLLKKDSNLFLLLHFILLLSLSIYLYGFFPISHSTILNINRNETSHKYYRHVDKLAFIVIDALRYDFVMSNTPQQLMPFLSSSILTNQSCLITTKANSPTVTMPRIKAITSGMISTYLDVILNFMSSDFKEDNLITRAASEGFKIVFYGDDTWLKLFPNVFLRSEGTNSFYVTDFTEVDNNVTRNIDIEFSKNDWDIIILHYLGLDHIGHLQGLNSPFLKPKLKEMDNIVKLIFNFLKEMELKRKIKTMLIVTGDHGMKDSGGHGGVTIPEVYVPLVSVGKNCHIFPGWPEKYEALQVDIAPTISALLGLPFPGGSIGKIIPSLLHNISTEEIIKILELNRLQLNKFKNSKEDSEFDFSKMVSNHDHMRSKKIINKLLGQKYYSYLNYMGQELVNNKLDFKYFYLVLGVIFLWINVIITLKLLCNTISIPGRFVQLFLVFGIISHGISLLSTSFIEEEHQTWYFLWITWCLLVVLENLSLRNLRPFFHKAKVSLPWISLCFMHRILRKLNQTGDKWAFLPDIKSYLNSTDGNYWSLLLFILGIIFVWWCAATEGCNYPQIISFGISLICIIFFRIATGNFHGDNLKFYFFSRGKVEIYIYWIFWITFAVQTFFSKSPAYLVWVLLQSLILRPHNVILLVFQVIISRQIHALFNKTEDIVWNNVAHWWLGNLFYFYQGNSNSVANIDVASGFVGIFTYNPIFAGIMVAAHTFNSHLLSFMLSPKTKIIYVFLIMFQITLYCTFLLFQLHHLFIWSVFSPKLLYEAGKSLVFFILMIFSTLFCKFQTESFSRHSLLATKAV